MKKAAETKVFDHSGSSFDSFLEEERIREEVGAVAIKRVLAWQLAQEMKQQRKTKQAMARDLQTSRSQLDRLLAPRNASVSLEARRSSIIDVPLAVHYESGGEGGKASPCYLFSNRSRRRTCSGVAQAASLAGRSEAYWL